MTVGVFVGVVVGVPVGVAVGVFVAVPVGVAVGVGVPEPLKPVIEMLSQLRRLVPPETFLSSNRTDNRLPIVKV